MRQLFLLLGATASLIAALFLVVNVGLPAQVTITGQPLRGEYPIAPALDAIAPSFQRPLLNGDSFSLLELRGQPVILNFWATWCGSCLTEMPALQAIYDDYRDLGLRVVAVNLGEPEATVRDWVQARNLTFDIVLDEAQQVSFLYQLRGVPSTYVIAPTGVISAIFYGPIVETELQAALAPYVFSPS